MIKELNSKNNHFFNVITLTKTHNYTNNTFNCKGHKQILHNKNFWFRSLSIKRNRSWK